MLAGLLAVAVITFSICCLLSIWVLGLSGYLVTIGALIVSVGSFLVIDASDSDGLSMNGVFTSITVFLFFLYFITAKFMMADRFFELLSTNRLKQFLVTSNKDRLPYSLIELLPYTLAATLVAYVFAVLIPGSI